MAVTAEELFLKEYDENGIESIIDDDGYFTNEFKSKLEKNQALVYWEEPLLEAEIGKVLSNETVDNEDHAVHKEAILKMNDRYFRVDYAGVGKDLDEYVDYDLTEVYPKEVVQTIYVEK